MEISERIFRYSVHKRIFRCGLFRKPIAKSCGESVRQKAYKCIFGLASYLTATIGRIFDQEMLFLRFEYAKKSKKML